jgi:pre-mRNA-splicing factor SYF2
VDGVVSLVMSETREARFKALRSRLAASTKANHAEVIAEHKRMKINPAQLSKLDRKKADAEVKLAKQDAEDAGDDFERKRAWDWTMEESEAWDRRLAEKQLNRDESGFADYTQTAEKSYSLNLKGFKPDLEGYKKAREDALAQGQVVQTEKGLVAVDEDRRFYADANSLGLTDHKPAKESIDRLVAETKKREAEKEAKRRKKRGGDDSDISYINKRNKVFNQKLARYVFQTCWLK